MFGRKKAKQGEVADLSGRFELHESLEAVVKKAGLDLSSLSVGLAIDERTHQVFIESRNVVMLSDGKQAFEWKVDSLRDLFRGGEEESLGDVLSDYPMEFTPLFYTIEQNLPLFLSGAGLPPTDGEFLDVYSSMRRRPDGRSQGSLHDFVWMNAAFMLGKYRCSESLYSAIFKRLEKSARTFKTGMSSRNYMNAIQTSFSQ
jgi:hypothetical protein